MDETQNIRYFVLNVSDPVKPSSRPLFEEVAEIGVRLAHKVFNAPAVDQEKRHRAPQTDECTCFTLICFNL